MSVYATICAHEASAVAVINGIPGLPVSIQVDDERGTGYLHLSAAASESLYMQLGAVLHGADEPAREAAYQEQQVKDAVANGSSTDADPGWVYIDHERRVVRDTGAAS